MNIFLLEVINQILNVAFSLLELAVALVNTSLEFHSVNF